MSNQLVKVIVAGILGGVALFLLPFSLIRVVVFFLIVSTIIRMFRPHGWRRGGFGPWHDHRYSDRWRNMTDEERRAFRDKMDKEFFSPAAVHADQP